MFVDASAIVAILMREAGFEALADRLRLCANPFTKAIAVYEAVLAVSRRTGNFSEAEAVVRAFLGTSRIALTPVGEAEGVAALAAFARYGKGQGHPAQLNLGDCFAYACARVRGVPLLYVGNDFAMTDLASV
ncbi:type II toxin-antitoxin system VapC family toxin [Methylobacterium sp. A54F]